MSEAYYLNKTVELKDDLLRASHYPSWTPECVQTRELLLSATRRSQFIRRLHTEGAGVGWKTELKGERCFSCMSLLAFDIFNHSFSYKLVHHPACFYERVISDHVSSWERRRAGLLPQPHHPHSTLFNPRKKNGSKRGRKLQQFLLRKKLIVLLCHIQHSVVVWEITFNHCSPAFTMLISWTEEEALRS